MKEFYLKKADENLPSLINEMISPEVQDKIMDNGDEIVIDLGNHYVGYFSFKVNHVDIYIDAPVRLYIKFCETKNELDYDFSEYNGSLCGSWLQDEIINIDFPGEYKMPRRYAARYIKLKVVATPKKIKLSDYKFCAVTSADVKKLSEVSINDNELLEIDDVAVNTLKNCMHRVFEDGPKRDRRLWIGDLRLEALANYYTFNNLELVKRCLYLFAASGINDMTLAPGFVYENPEFAAGSWYLVDYALLFVAAACDYYNFTGDIETFSDIYPVIKTQMDAVNNMSDENGIINVPEGYDVFIDWCEGLEKVTSLNGVYLYVLNMLADVLKKTENEDALIYNKRYEELKHSVENVLYDKEKNAFVNKTDNYQYSVHSAVWMVLGEVVSGREAEEILFNVLNSSDSIKPFTPYMHHYVCEAMIKLNLMEEVTDYIKSYWGGMVKLGADTFYEAYVPNDLEFSPYGDRKINSMCHAWSCTPSYFIRKYICE